MKKEEFFKSFPDYKDDEFKKFNKLCEKAQFLLFKYSHLEPYEMDIFSVISIDEDLVNLSPIEQILSVALYLVDFYANKLGYDFTISFTNQHIIKTSSSKTYYADIYIDSVINYKKGYEYELCNPLIVECDGFNYHSNKKQMNYDYERENDLKIEGYNLIRFTGSQIYNKPIECALKIYDYVKNMEVK